MDLAPLPSRIFCAPSPLRSLAAILLAFGLGSCALSGERTGPAGPEKSRPRTVDVAWLGVKVQDVPEGVARYYDLGTPRGAIIIGLTDGGPAKGAGLGWGDLILAVDGIEVGRPEDLTSWSGIVGREQVAIGVLRGGQRGEVKVALPANRAEPPAASAPPPGEAAPVRSPPPPAPEPPPAPPLPPVQPAAPVQKPAALAPEPAPPPQTAAPKESAPPPAPAQPPPPAKAAEGTEGAVLRKLVEYRRAVETEPQNSRAHNSLGVALSLLGQNREALEEFDRAVALDPGFAEAHFNRGLALWGLGRLDEAVAAYAAASRSAPGFLESRAAQADGLAQLGRLEEALQVNTEALALAPASSEVHRQRGDILRGLRRLPEAEAAYRKALALKPDEPEARLALGIVLDEQGRSGESIQVFDLLIQGGKAGATVYHNRAAARLHGGDAAGALADAEKALGLEPRFPAAWCVRAEALVALGKPDEAVLAWGEALAVVPDYLPALKGLDDLARGLRSRQEGLRKIQGWLAAAGRYEGEPDGVWGPRSQEALIRFQQEEGVPAEGRIDGLTLLRLVRRAARSATGPRG